MRRFSHLASLSAVLGRSATVLAGLAIALAAATAATADGDPASDTLLQQDVFLPFPAPSTGAAKALGLAVAAVYAKGDRLKVAVIATPADLGAIPSLFGKPDDYAHFLGSELQFFYVGPLLVVMPAGFGIYDGGRDTSAEEKVLGGLHVQGSSPDDLTGSATAAAKALLAANALASKDIVPPYVQTLPTTAKRGTTARIQYYLGDDSHKAAATIELDRGTKVVASLELPLHAVALGKLYVARLPLPKTLGRSVLQACITGVDGSGNRSQKACSQLTVR
jgi:hypothetical protein